MTIHAEQSVLDVVFGPKVKVVFAAIDAACAARVMTAGKPEANGVEALAFRPARDAECGRLHSLACREGEFVPLAGPPSGCCVLVALSEPGRRDLAALETWWRENGRGEPPAVLELYQRGSTGPEDERIRSMELYRHLWQVAWDAVRASDQRLAELNGEVYELRLEYEQTRHALQRWQADLELLKKTTCHITYVMPHSDRTFRPAADCVVRQRLPVSGLGFAGFDLFFPSERAPHARQGCLVVVLQDPMTETALAGWRVPYNELARGWCGFTLPAALAGPVHHLELVVMWQTVSGRPPSLSVSPVGAFEELSAGVDGQPLGAALAFVAWGALPKSKIGGERGAWFQPTADETELGCFEYRLALHDVARIRAGSTADFEYMHLLPDVPGFRLHPLEQKLATAILPKACLAGTDRLVATAEIRGDEAKHPVEYAMCLTDAAAGCAVFPDAPDRDERVVGFSGWQLVAADRRPHAVSLSLPEPLSAPADLHFGTRMSASRRITSHCADWLEVRIRLRHGVAKPLNVSESG